MHHLHHMWLISGKISSFVNTIPVTSACVSVFQRRLINQTLLIFCFIWKNTLLMFTQPNFSQHDDICKPALWIALPHWWSYLNSFSFDSLNPIPNSAPYLPWIINGPTQQFALNRAFSIMYEQRVSTFVRRVLISVFFSATLTKKETRENKGAVSIHSTIFYRLPCVESQQGWSLSQPHQAKQVHPGQVARSSQCWHIEIYNHTHLHSHLRKI